MVRNIKCASCEWANVSRAPPVAVAAILMQHLVIHPASARTKDRFTWWAKRNPRGRFQYWLWIYWREVFDRLGWHNRLGHNPFSKLKSFSILNDR
jgi:hypothetical protein